MYNTLVSVLTAFFRGINAGSKQDLDDLSDAMSAVEMSLVDIIDSRFPFSKSDEAIEYVWQGKQVGKVVVEVDLEDAKESS